MILNGDVNKMALHLIGFPAITTGISAQFESDFLPVCPQPPRLPVSLAITILVPGYPQWPLTPAAPSLHRASVLNVKLHHSPEGV